MDTNRPLELGPLTDDQRRALRLLAGGLTPGELALRLGLSRRAARRAVAGLLAALAVASVEEARLLWWGSRAGARADLRRTARGWAA
jgi:DNA-binding CsgD family transcriptional regulator